EARKLIISGGNIITLDQTEKYKLNTKGDSTMRIAVTYEDGQIFQHFGHTENFKVYDVENNKVTDSKVINTNGTGHGALATLLNGLDVDVLICGGIGGGAQMALAEAGIKLYGGVFGDADSAVDALLKGELEYNPNVMCSHHHHEEGHSCGSHSCGHHSCH
ncbi:NifB/NifX family molybdenum-iron cluster-binding protein, partial [Bullifex sp.]|uniref:NifB/NifX family molybdenum-iron cluster-binding protein n=1 Tax=Bullifex sp. TaxID=2815808 RepID=UPI002A7F42BE